MHPRYLLILSATLTCRSSAASRRSNLYFRLIVFPIETPPLRERLEDVIALAADFLQQPAKRLNITVPRLTDENIRELCNYG